MRVARATALARIPAAVALVLSLPCVGVPYFWDDYLFLTRAQDGFVAALAHTPGSAFYRPIAQGLYFLALVPFGTSGAILAHLVNLLLVVISTVLLALLVSDLAGQRAGILSGLFFAALGTLPGLVAWASGSQDLLAIAFLLVSLHLRHRGRIVWSVAAAAAGLLSKESILVALPVLIFWDTIVGRERSRVGSALVGFGALAVAWAVLHPGLPTALAPAEDSMSRYVGFRNPAISEHHLRGYLGALVNVPLVAPVRGVPEGTVACGAVAALVALGGLVGANRSLGPARGPVSTQRVIVVGLMIAIPGVILPSLVIHRWVAYYACLPAVGVAVIAGTLCARLPQAPALALVAAWLAMGIVTRGMDSSSGILNERSFLEGGRAVRTVEQGFRRLHPSLPRGSQILASVASSGMLGIHGTLIDSQAPRVWYDDPTLRTLPPERRLPGRPSEILVRVTGDRRVVEILPDRLEYRASAAGPVDENEVRMVIRTYARGLAASGEAERSARILGTLAEREIPLVRSQDLRLAAMALAHAGEGERAERLVVDARPMPREQALDAIARVLAQPTRLPELDSTAYWAFGISPDDADALRTWMAMFYGSELYAQALHMAERLQRIRPGDSESAEVARKAKVRLRPVPMRD
ncbi:MAG TPA: hypothetical protein VFP58_10540 [Candidatus Eisenbacteria bacterium]|nr:hypothetical protein [Candidatus Eisenbacteria bacterium]